MFENLSKNDTLKIDIVSVPFDGHLLPLITLVKPLLELQGIRLRVFTGVQKAALLEAAGFEVIPLFPHQPTLMEDIANTAQSTNPVIAYRQLKANMILIPQVAKELEEAWTKERPDLMMADFISVPAGLVANKLGIPWITTFPTPFAIESHEGPPAYLGGWKPRKGLLFQCRDWLGRKTIHLGKRVLFALLAHHLGDYKPNSLYDAEGCETIYSPYSQLALGLKEIEFRSDFPKQLLWVPYACESFREETIEAWTILKDGRPSIFVTFGTHVLWSKQRMVEMVKELAKEYPNYRFVVSLGKSSESQKDFQQVSENILLFAYIPYERVLPYMSFVIHHGGAGILYASLAVGLPSLIIPLDYDQFDYALRAELAGIAYRAPFGNKKKIKAQFHAMLHHKDWSSLYRLASKLQQTEEQRRENILEIIQEVLGRENTAHIN